jgi:hypothetical protein
LHCSKSFITATTYEFIKKGIKLMTQKTALTNAMIARAKLGDKEYTLWDGNFKGLEFVFDRQE